MATDDAGSSLFEGKGKWVALGVAALGAVIVASSGEAEAAVPPPPAPGPGTPPPPAPHQPAPSPHAPPPTDQLAALEARLRASAEARKIFAFQALLYSARVTDATPDGIAGSVTNALVAQVRAAQPTAAASAPGWDGTLRAANNWIIARAGSRAAVQLRVIPQSGRLPAAVLDLVNATVNAAVPGGQFVVQACSRERPDCVHPAPPAAPAPPANVPPGTSAPAPGAPLCTVTFPAGTTVRTSPSASSTGDRATVPQSAAILEVGALENGKRWVRVRSADGRITGWTDVDPAALLGVAHCPGVALCEFTVGADVTMRDTATESGAGTTLAAATLQALEKGARTADNNAVLVRARVKDGPQAGRVGWVAMRLERFRQVCPGV